MQHDNLQINPYLPRYGQPCKRNNSISLCNLNFVWGENKTYCPASGCDCGSEAMNSGKPLYDSYILAKVGNLDCKRKGKKKEAFDYP